MVTLTFDDQQISIPQSWEDIKLGDYERWFTLEPRNRIEQVQLVANICGIDSEILLDNPTQLFDTVYDIVRFAFDNYDREPTHSILIDGQVYEIAQTENLTLAEWVDIENVFESGSESRLSDVLSILCRPVGEAYYAEKCDARKPFFKNMPMDRAMPLLAFFLQQRERYLIASNLYSEVSKEGDQCLRLIRSFVENGDGTKSLLIWQRIKYFFLMKFLKRQLSKFSDSCSTASTKLKPKTT